MQALIEIACFSVEGAIIAAHAGAHRIELCRNYSEGGLTPEKKDILEAKEKIAVPLHVIIRPRRGNFEYNTVEVDQMKKDIIFCRGNKIDGIVFGVLEGEKIDKRICGELADLARPMSLTFHRAIDACADIERSVEELIEMGFKRVLTSGGRATASEGIDRIKELQNKFGDRIIIMPGGGIRSENILQLKKTGCYEFHSSAILQGETPNVEEIKRLCSF